jgi:hypothetical protein
MNRKISIAVGTAAAVAFAGAAMASDLVTINSSEGYTQVGSEAFMPHFLRDDCGHQPGAPGGGSPGDDTYSFLSGNCSGHGEVNVGNAAGLTGGDNSNYWTGGDSVPNPAANDEASGYTMLDGQGDAFDNGLFNTGNTSFFTGLSLGWNSLADALAMPDAPMGVATGATSNAREFWIDQTVIGYVETKLDTDSNQGNGGEGPTTLAQNFRSSLTFTGSTDLSAVSNHIDQRLEQMVELTLGSNNIPNGTTGAPGNANEFEASRQTLQMAFALDAGGTVGGGAGFEENNTTQPDMNNEAHEESQGQLVAQDIEGFFFSCINCDTQALIGAGAAHAFTPEAIDAHYMPYVAGWQTVPTVTHAPQ